MNSTTLRDQLQSLSIEKSKRPAARASSSGRGWLVLFAVAVLAGLAALFFGRERLVAWGQAALAQVKSEPAAQVTLVKVTATTQQPEMGAVLTASGKMVSDHQVEVATKVSGQIVELAFEQGDQVSEGQTLARLEEKNYRALRDQAAALLEKARATRRFRETDWQRLQTIDRMWSEIEVADVRRALDEATAEVRAAEAALAFAQKQLDDCEVLAPITGVILERNVEVGDFVAAEGGRGAQANAQFAAIADMSKLRVEVDVSELDIARLYKGMPCVITPDAYKDRKYEGQVLWIDPGANYAKATVQVKVRIENPDEYLRVQGSAQVQFLRDAATQPADAEPQIWIPLDAVQLAADGRSGDVFVADQGRLRSVRVRLGEQRGQQVRLLEGLSPGQQIARGDLARLSEGQRIR